jgi:uncharacterized SAM-binding protein YcdF (DUF218 family)
VNRTGWRGRAGHLALYSFAGAGVTFLLILYTPLPNLLALPLYGAPEEPRRADVIVVLAAWRNSDGLLNEAGLRRTIAGARLYRQGLAPYILFSGGPCCGRSVSSAMADFAAELGVPRPAILLEEDSVRTHESAINTAVILRARGMKSALLVSSPVHLLRARLSFAAAGVQVFPGHGSRKDVWAISGAGDRFSLFQEATHEYVGLVFYRMRGWI